MFQGISELLEKAIAALTKAVSWAVVSVRQSWLELLTPPVLSLPPPHLPLLGWSSCVQAAWGERSRNSSVLEKTRRGGCFWPGSVP